MNNSFLITDYAVVNSPKGTLLFLDHLDVITLLKGDYTKGLSCIKTSDKVFYIDRNNPQGTQGVESLKNANSFIIEYSPGGKKPSLFFDAYLVDNS